MPTLLRQGCAPFVAEVLASPAPRAMLARHGIALVVRLERLELPGRIVQGAWDPVLRRIELFGVGERSDEELVATFAHELLHALGGREIRDLEEAAVHDNATGLVRALDSSEVARLARGLRP